MELEQHRPEFESLGLGLAAISYDSPAILRNFAERRNIHFPLLSDTGSKIIRSVGLLNETVPKDSPFFGIPNPGVFVLDAKGTIKAKYFEEDFRQRFTAGDILTRQYGVQPSAGKQEVAGRQLTAVTSASNFVVRGGQRVALAIDIELKPGMHVSAPGVEGYIPIEWKMNNSDAAAAHDVTVPPAKRLKLKAINEVVPAFEGRFRLMRDITIAAEPKLKPLADASGRFTVTGVLRYQACDDHICYVPQELPLKWTFQLEGHDRERVPVELQRKPGR